MPDDITKTTGTQPPVLDTGEPAPTTSSTEPLASPPPGFGPQPVVQDPAGTASDQSAQTAAKPPSQESVIASPQTPKKYGGKKMIATIFGVLFLIAAVAVAVYFVQRQQSIQERAASGSACDQHPDCELLEDPGNSGTYIAPRTISHLFITAKYFSEEFNSQNTDDGCYRVSIDGVNLQWQRYGDGPECKDISNIQVWLGGFQATPTQGLEISASCGAVKAYSLTWNQLSQADLNALDAGSTVRFAVEGTTNSGSFDKAKFIVNGNETETTTKRPGTDEYYIEYVVPEGITSFTVNAQVHHTSLGWF